MISPLSAQTVSHLPGSQGVMRSTLTVHSSLGLMCGTSTSDLTAGMLPHISDSWNQNTAYQGERMCDVKVIIYVVNNVRMPVEAGEIKCIPGHYRSSMQKYKHCKAWLPSV